MTTYGFGIPPGTAYPTFSVLIGSAYWQFFHTGGTHNFAADWILLGEIT